MKRSDNRIPFAGLFFLLSLLVFPVPGWAGERLFLSPQENLESVDLSVLDQAQTSIDIAMYAFTDKKIARELVRLAQRGVKIRLYRDAIQVRDRGDVLDRLENVPNISIRIKSNRSWNIMHLKAYLVDGRLLREGSANWSPAGEGANCFRGDCGHREQQDNTLLVTDDPAAVESFRTTFDRIWTRPDNRVP